MGHDLGILLRRWRHERALSLTALAARAGLAKGTLSGWETGHHQPRLRQLEALLTTLDVSPDERTTALTLIDAPRAYRSLASTAPPLVADQKEEDRPVPGHFLRALRQRRGLTLNAVARAIGCIPGTVSRWERSETTPTPEHLSRLLKFLGARAKEQRALTVDRHRLRVPPLSRSPSLDVLQEQFAALVSRVMEDGDRRLMELEFLAWQAAIWPRATGSAAARELLIKAWARYASWLTWGGRPAEADVFARRALTLLAAEGGVRTGLLETWELAVHTRALFIAHGTARNARVAAMSWLQQWLPAVAGTRCESPLYRFLADEAWWAGQPEAALAFSERAYMLARPLDDESVEYLSRRVWADMLLRSGQPERAAAVLSPPKPDLLPFERILAVLQWVALRYTLGDPEAGDWLAEGYALIERYEYPEFRVTADALARRCWGGLR
jgi:transcriptional regulator with XRE-family HTH domain